ncbi:MAG: hypothetical protein WCR85_00175 [Sphaerochaeta sp.]
MSKVIIWNEHVMGTPESLENIEPKSVHLGRFAYNDCIQIIDVNDQIILFYVDALLVKDNTEVAPNWVGGGFKQVCNSLALKIDGTLVYSGGDFDPSIPIPEGVTAQKIGANSSAMVALLTDGTIITWKNSDYSSDDLQNPPEGTFSDVVVGHNVAFAIGSDSTLQGWGSNSDGLLNSPEGYVAKEVAIGDGFAMGLGLDGTITLWGNNANSIPPVPSGLVAEHIAAGATHCVAVKSDGNVVAWGGSPAEEPPM